MAYDYSSIQIDITGSLRQQILRESMKIKAQDLYLAKDGYGREKDPHVTVKYGLTTPYPTEVKPLFKDIDEVSFTLGKVLIFECDDFDVVRFRVEDKKNLRELHRRIAKHLDCPGDTHPSYNPHITLAYVKKGEGRKYIGERALTGKEFTSKTATFSGKEDNQVVLDLGYTDQDADNCIGVDFDGTLAHYDKWRGWKHLGKPVPAMVNRVKDWLKQGQNVKIFTARYSGPDRDRIKPLFAKWCKDNDLPVLELTNEKTPGMHEFWDDRAVRVVRNRGITKTGAALL